MKDLISGAEALMRSLEYQGVETIFGYPGGSIMPVFDALYDHRDTLNHILVRHEQGAAHAAQGFARSSGEVGVCLVTSGPGATNTVTGLADAMMDSTPVVLISGQVGSGFLGTDDTILYSSCFDANGGLFETILTADDAVISLLRSGVIRSGVRKMYLGR